ncbi:uncharacterized protein BX664DRAFT_315751 [Halteromyces radiatus]|uniref:uncharacterized protein n=1 Tax=Halteromyces radiatus TaxID=101107 RepID=UPI00221ECCF6|nr:uncharacterized protein BX664DRAFT_315751 [Halteromyces radiatus]KAI8086562.1 hypothetical protein BX664DRAFT_315751 [Halteromyces radiatus]
MYFPRIWFICCLIFVMINHCQCFCIRSNLVAPTSMHVIQRDGAGTGGPGLYEVDIGPGGSSCCHFSNTDCNFKGTADAIVGFTFTTWINNERVGPFEFHIPAGGSSEVSGDANQPTIHTYDQRGQPYNYDGPLIGDRTW